MKVEYDEKKKEWIELLPHAKEGMYLDGYLKKKLDNIRMIQKKDWDCFFLIDGMEGSGKSTLGLTCAWYLSDKKFTKDNICKSAKEAIDKLANFPDESVLMIDEGDLAFSSREVWNHEQILLIKLTKVIRFKKMIMIIIAPTFFDLNRGIARRRSRFLLHVYTGRNMQRGRFAFYGEKRKEKLYEIGRKNFNTYSKVKSNFVGSFVAFNPLGEDYHEAKKEIVQGLVEHKAEVVSKKLLVLQYRISQLPKKFDILVKELSKHLGVSDRAIEKWDKIPLKYPFLLEELADVPNNRPTILNNLSKDKENIEQEEAILA